MESAGDHVAKGSEAGVAVTDESSLGCAKPAVGEVWQGGVATAFYN